MITALESVPLCWLSFSWWARQSMEFTAWVATIWIKIMARHSKILFWFIWLGMRSLLSLRHRKCHCRTIVAFLRLEPTIFRTVTPSHHGVVGSSQFPASEIFPLKEDYMTISFNNGITILPKEIISSSHVWCIASTSKTRVHSAPTYPADKVTGIFIVSKCNDCAEIEQGDSQDNTPLIKIALYVTRWQLCDFLPHRKNPLVFRLVSFCIRFLSFM